jgi:hypothetical protein
MRSNSLQKKVFLPFPIWEGAGGWVNTIANPIKNKMRLPDNRKVFCSWGIALKKMFGGTE